MRTAFYLVCLQIDDLLHLTLQVHGREGYRNFTSLYTNYQGKCKITPLIETTQMTGLIYKPTLNGCAFAGSLST